MYTLWWILQEGAVKWMIKQKKICTTCYGQGIYQGCNHCTWNDDMCSYCDGTGHVECNFIGEDWHS